MSRKFRVVLEPEKETKNTHRFLEVSAQMVGDDGKLSDSPVVMAMAYVQKWVVKRLFPGGEMGQIIIMIEAKE